MEVVKFEHEQEGGDAGVQLRRVDDGAVFVCELEKIKVASKRKSCELKLRARAAVQCREGARVSEAGRCVGGTHTYTQHP